MSYILLYGLSVVCLLRQVFLECRARVVLIPVIFRIVIYEAVLVPDLAVPYDGLPQRRVGPPCRRVVHGEAAVEQPDQLLNVGRFLQLGAPGRRQSSQVSR